MIDLNVHRKYDCETGKSEYQCHMEWLRGLLINMQEIGVDDRYGDNVSSDLVSEIKWLTNMIEIAKRENEFINTNNRNAIELTEKEMKVSKLINGIASCLCYPNDSCYPNIKTVTHEFETIFSNSKQVEHIKNNERSVKAGIQFAMEHPYKHPKKLARAKARVIQSTLKIPATNNFYYLVEYKEHWWTKWKVVEDPISHNHCPLFFETKEAAIKYIKKI